MLLRTHDPKNRRSLLAPQWKENAQLLLNHAEPIFGKPPFSNLREFL